MADTLEDQEQSASPPLATELGLGALESLFNTLLDLDPDIQARLRAHAPLVIRVKTRDPSLLFHVHLTAEGVELSSHAPAPSRIRINGSLIALLGLLLGNRDLTGNDDVNVWGDADEIAWLRQLLHDLNIRTSAQRWLRDHVNLGDLVRKIRGHDPSWITDLLPMPGMLREALQEIRSLQKRLEGLQTDWEVHQAELLAQRRRDVMLVALVMVGLVLDLLPGMTLPARLAGLEVTQLSWMALVAALLYSRFWRR